MRDEFKLYHVDMTPFPAHTAEMERQVLVCNGYERPRFVDTGRRVGGYLGIDDWGNYWQKPTYNQLVAGSLNASKFYSVKAVPLDTSQAYATGILNGSPTLPSIPIRPTSANGGIRWNLPEHTQWESHECGRTSADAVGGVEDETKTWTVNQWVGMYVWNPETDQREIITANDATTLTAAGFDLVESKYYAIQQKTVKRIAIYAAEMDSPQNLVAASFHYQAVVDGSGPTTWDMKDFALSNVFAQDDIIQPPNAFVCHEAGGRTYIGGGIREERGTAYVDMSVEQVQASSDPNEGVDVALVAALRDAVAARLMTDKIRFVAQTAGAAGNNIRVGLLNTGADTLSVGVAGNDISVTLRTDEGTKANAIWGQINEARVRVTADTAGISFNDWILSFNYQETPGAGMYAVLDGTVIRVYLGNAEGEAFFDDAKNTRELIVQAINELDAGVTAEVAGEAGSIATVGQVQLRFGKEPIPLSTAAEIAAEIVATPAADALVFGEVIAAGAVSELPLTNLSGGEDDAVAEVGQDDDEFGRFMRYTLQSAIADMTNIERGSVVTVTNSDNAGNNVTDAIVTRVDPDKRWFEIHNEDGVVAADNQSMTIDITHNVVIGDDDTLFAEAMQGGTILFSTDTEPFAIRAVDRLAQKLMLRDKYDGRATDIADKKSFVVQTFNHLYWSDNANPHTYRAANYAEFPENIVAIATYQETLLVFCERNIYVYSIEQPESQPLRISSAQVHITAPWSVSASPSNGVLFWDGNGFSITDGVRVVSVTKDTCQWLMEGVHRDMEWNIRSVWDNKNQRWLTAFPYGGDATNNYGLIITGSDRRVYGVQMVDVNAFWVAPSADGHPVVRHGTSSRGSGVYGGIIFDHDIDQPTDGLPANSGFIARVTGHNPATREITIHCDRQITASPGTPCLAWPQTVSPSYYKNFMISAIEEDTAATSPYVYTVSYGSDWDLDSVITGDLLFIGGIVVDYGIKWTNFGSPHYRHNVRRIEIDCEPFTGFVIIDHYANNDETRPIFSESKIVAGEHKILSSPKRGGHYTYGFRIRAIAATKIRVDNITILFDPVT